MQEYALLVDGQFKEIRVLAERPSDIPHKGVAWYPVDHGQQPSFDDETHTLDVTQSLVGGVWQIRKTVRPVTPAEVKKRNADRRARSDGELNNRVGLALHDVVNRLRVLEGQNVMTPKQFKDWFAGL